MPSPFPLRLSTCRFFKLTSITVLLCAFTASAHAAACAPGSASPSVTICTPTNGATVASPVEVSAAANSSPVASLIQIYLDGVKNFETHASSLDTNVTMSAGTHRLTVQAY